jgi:hypothetical protein
MNTWIRWNKTHTVGSVQNLDESGPRFIALELVPTLWVQASPVSRRQLS